MTVAPSIDPARFLHELLELASLDLFREMLTTFINALLSADSLTGHFLRSQRGDWQGFL